jgi:putative two-component system response regulator
MKKKVILAMDDLTTSLMIIRSILHSRFDIRLFKSAGMALEMLNRIGPDLILLDIEMPEMTGFEVLKIIRSKPESSHIPVIFVTSHMSAEFIDQAMASGVDGYVVKPFIPEALVKRINSVLENSVQARVKPIPGEAPASGSPAGSRRLPALKQACMTGDSFGAEALLEELQKRGTGPETNKNIGELHRLIINFDWDLALEKIGSLPETL